MTIQFREGDELSASREAIAARERYAGAVEVSIVMMGAGVLVYGELGMLPGGRVPGVWSHVAI